MTQPHNPEAARRRAAERFDQAVVDEGLIVSDLLEADEFLDRYGEQVETLSQEAFRRSPEEASVWIEENARSLGFRAVVLTTSQDELVGFTWGAPLGLHTDTPAAVVWDAGNFIEEQRRTHNVEQDDVLYSSALAIQSERRGQGLGSGLALRAIAMCREQLHTEGALLFYRTRPDNPVSNAISENLGATRTEYVSPETRKPLWLGYIEPADVA
jgi:GNAT superfamily N-acetyltransferase